MRANVQLLRATTPDDRNYAQVVARVSQDNGAVEARLIAQRAKLYADCYAVLAPVQKTRLAEVQARCTRWTEQHGQHMRRHGHDMDAAEPGPSA